MKFPQYAVYAIVSCAITLTLTLTPLEPLGVHRLSDLLSDPQPTIPPFERGWLCEPLAIDYPQISFPPRWLDVDTVVFEVTNGEREGSIFGPPLFIWYQYHASTGILEQLEDSPFNQSNLTLYMNLSPDRGKLVYARQDGDSLEYWLVDNQTHTEIPLGISGGLMQTLWSNDERRFLMQNAYSSYTYSTAPVYLVTMMHGQIDVQRLDEIPALVDILPSSKAYDLHGMSLDGRYIVITPEFVEFLSWIVDLDQQVVTKLNFTFRSPVVWTDEVTITGITDAGAVRYDLEIGRQELLVSADALALYDPQLPLIPSAFIGADSLSPDGRYMLGSSISGIFICPIY